MSDQAGRTTVFTGEGITAFMLAAQLTALKLEVKGIYGHVNAFKAIRKLYPEMAEFKTRAALLKGFSVFVKKRLDEWEAKGKPGVST